MRTRRMMGLAQDDGAGTGRSGWHRTDNYRGHGASHSTSQVPMQAYCPHITAKSQPYCHLIVKVKGLVKFVKIVSVAQEKLTELCGKLVVKDCATRWNSVLFVIERLLEIRTHTEQVLKELKHDSSTNTEWDRVSDLQRHLHPFREMTGALQTDMLSLSSVIPSICELSLHLQDPSLPKLQAETLLLSLRKRFSQFFGLFITKL